MNTNSFLIGAYERENWLCKLHWGQTGNWQFSLNISLNVSKIKLYIIYHSYYYRLRKKYSAVTKVMVEKKSKPVSGIKEGKGAIKAVSNAVKLIPSPRVLKPKKPYVMTESVEISINQKIAEGRTLGNVLIHSNGHKFYLKIGDLGIRELIAASRIDAGRVVSHGETTLESDKAAMEANKSLLSKDSWEISSGNTARIHIPRIGYFASLANTGNNNCKLSYSKGKLTLKSTKVIHPGNPIRVAYGKDLTMSLKRAS